MAEILLIIGLAVLFFILAITLVFISIIGVVAFIEAVDHFIDYFWGR